jgi:hypothetical protein
MEVLDQVRCRSLYHSNGAFTKTDEQLKIDTFITMCLFMGMFGFILFFC